MHYRIQASKLQGNITVPPSKSHTLRAILFASLAKGKSIIRNYLPSPDTQAMIQACQLLGATITVNKDYLTILGTDGKPKTPDNIIDAGNSGQVFRFIAAVSALTSGYTVITGDHSVRNHRPIQPLLEGLNYLNVFAVSTQGNGSGPIIIKGPLKGGTTTLDGEDSQPISGLLIACALTNKNTVINVKNAGEKPWIDLTLDWFKRLKINYQRQGYRQYRLPGNASFSGFEYTVPGDFSSCAFPLVAALITRSEISLNNLDMNDAQGDKALIFTLQEMGASIEIQLNEKTLQVKSCSHFVGKNLNVNNYIDAVPILAVMGCFAQNKMVITGASIARKKETDRLSVIIQELRKMGAKIAELEDGFIVRPTPLIGTRVCSFGDHRIAMSLAIAALSAEGETIIENTGCVEKSYPNFAEALKKLGASIEVH